MCEFVFILTFPWRACHGNFPGIDVLWLKQQYNKVFAFKKFSYFGIALLLEANNHDLD